jgi:hypothetical protein
LRSVCIFCGSSAGAGSGFQQAARDLGKEMAARRITLIYGGGGAGLMGAAADAALDHGGHVIGVLPKILAERERAHQRVREMHYVETMHERKAMMYELAEAFIAMPGGIGTLEELCEVLTWIGIGQHHKPIGILNVDHYYDPFLSLLDHMVDKQFMKRELRDFVLVHDDPRLLIDALQAKADNRRTP